jgi:hypothetical protein
LSISTFDLLYWALWVAHFLSAWIRDSKIHIFQKETDMAREVLNRSAEMQIKPRHTAKSESHLIAQNIFKEKET